MTFFAVLSLIIGGTIFPIFSMKLNVTFDEKWDLGSLLSACKTCSVQLKPPAIYLQPPPFPQTPDEIIPLLGPVIIYPKQPLKGSTFIVLSKADYKELRLLSWKRGICYTLLVLNTKEHPITILELLWNEYQIYSVYVIMRSSPDKIFTYNPFLKKLHQSEKAVLNKFNTFYGSKLNVVLFPRPPIIAPVGKDRFTGPDGEMLGIFRMKMNLTSLIRLPTDGKRYGYKMEDGTFAGTLKDILEGRADLAINGHFIKDYGTKGITFSRYISDDKLCAVVPKAEQIPHVFVLLKCFSVKVWFSVLTSYVIFGIVRIVTVRLLQIQSTGVTISIVRNIFTAPNFRRSDIKSVMIWQIFLITFTFIIVNAFQGQIVTFLNTPIYYPEMETFQDVLDSDLEIWSSQPEVEWLTNDLEHKHKIKRTSEEELKCAADTKTIVRFFRYNYIDKATLSSGDQHIVSEYLNSFFIGYIVQFGSPYLPRMNILIDSAVESGLVNYWIRKSHGFIDDRWFTSHERQTKVLSLEDLEIAFIIIFVGLSISFCIFIAEIIVNKRKMRNNFINELSPSRKDLERRAVIYIE